MQLRRAYIFTAELRCYCLSTKLPARRWEASPDKDSLTLVPAID
jgi:hypothetical protein